MAVTILERSEVRPSRTDYVPFVEAVSRGKGTLGKLGAKISSVNNKTDVVFPQGALTIIKPGSSDVTFTLGTQLMVDLSNQARPEGSLVLSTATGVVRRYPLGDAQVREVLGTTGDPKGFEFQIPSPNGKRTIVGITKEVKTKIPEPTSNNPDPKPTVFSYISTTATQL